MSDKEIKEINKLLSTNHYEDALSAIRRVSDTDKTEELFLKEAYILLSMDMLKQCGDFCMEHSDKFGKFESSILLKACESRYIRRNIALAPIGECQPVRFDFNNLSPMFIMSLFCDIKDAKSFLDTAMHCSNDPVYPLTLANIMRLSGEFDAALKIVNSLPQGKQTNELNERLAKEKEIFEKRKSLPASAKQELENFDRLTTEELCVRGFWSIGEKDSISAFKYFGEAVKKDPTAAIAWYYVGVLQSVLGAKDRGELCFTKFSELFPQSPGFYKNQILNAPKSTPSSQIEKWYQQRIGYMPTDLNAWFEYLSYLYRNDNILSARLIASYLLDNNMKNWTISRDSAAYYIYSGILKLLTTRLSSAEESFRSALKYDGSKKSIAHLYLGYVLDMIGSSADAIENYEKAAEDSSATYISKYLTINNLLKRRNFKKASKMVEEIVEKHPRSPLACLKKAEVYFAQSDIKSLRKFINGLKKEQKSPEIAILNAMISMLDLKLDVAIAVLEEGHKNYPNSLLILKNLSYLYYKSGKYEKILSMIEAANIKPEDPDLMLLRGSCELMLSNTEKAQETISNYLLLEPFSPYGWHMMAEVAHTLGKYSMTVYALKNAAYFSGGKFTDRFNYAISTATEGGYDKAIQMLQSSEANKYVTEKSLFILSTWLQYATGNYDQALDKLEKFKKNNIDTATIKIAIEYAKGAQKEQLFESIDRAISEYGELPQFIYNKAYLAMKAGELEQAEKYLDDSLAKNPNFYEALIAKAVLCWLKKDQQAGAEAVKKCKKLKHPSFKSWVKKASSVKDPLESICFYDKVTLNFLLPDMFTLEYNDPLDILSLNKLDGIFQPL